MQNEGYEKQKKEGEAMVDGYSHITQGIPFVEKELHAKNYGKMIGIMTWIMKKGSLGEAPAWCAIILHRALQDPTFRKHASENRIQGFGKLAYGTPFKSLLTYFLSRNDVEPYSRGEQDYSQLTDNVLAFKTMNEVRQLIQANGIDEDTILKEKEKKYLQESIDALRKSSSESAVIRKNLVEDRAIAKVMSGQEVTLADGSILSIYQTNPIFQEYRDFVATAPANYKYKPDESPEEHYRETSEAMMMPLTYVNKLFALPTTSSSSFPNQNASNFVSGIAEEYVRKKRLGDTHPIFITFEHEIRKRLDSARQAVEAPNSQWRPATKNAIVEAKSYNIDTSLSATELADAYAWIESIMIP